MLRDDRRTPSPRRTPRRTPRRILHRAAWATAFLLIGALPGWPLATRLEATETKEGVVFKAAPLRVAAGEQGELRVTLTIPPGRGLIAKPAPNNSATALILTLVAGEGIAPLQPEYPDGRKITDEDGFVYHTYEGQVTIKVPVKVAPAAIVGPHVLQGKMRYQPIHSGNFGRTAVLPIEVTIEVTAAKKAPEKKPEPKAAPTPKPAATPKPAPPATRP